jgi:hypothetical protein
MRIKLLDITTIPEFWPENRQITAILILKQKSMMKVSSALQGSIMGIGEADRLAVKTSKA